MTYLNWHSIFIGHQIYCLIYLIAITAPLNLLWRVMLRLCQLFTHLFSFASFDSTSLFSCLYNNHILAMRFLFPTGCEPSAYFVVRQIIGYQFWSNEKLYTLSVFRCHKTGSLQPLDRFQSFSVQDWPASCCLHPILTVEVFNEFPCVCAWVRDNIHNDDSLHEFTETRVSVDRRWNEAVHWRCHIQFSAFHL